MKHPLLLGLSFALSLSAFAQPLPQPAPLIVGGPIELKNPHRRDEGFGKRSDSNGNELVGGVPQPAIPAPALPVVQAEPPVSMLADGPFLFVLRGDTLMQFDKKTLRLLNSLQLPRLGVPALASKQSGLPSPVSGAPTF